VKDNRYVFQTFWYFCLDVNHLHIGFFQIKGDGLIQLRELEHVMRACMEENGMKFSDEQIEDLTIALFEDADQGNREAITFEALKKQLEKHEGLLENLTIRLDKNYIRCIKFINLQLKKQIFI